MKFTKKLTLLISMFLLLIVGCTQKIAKTSNLRNNYPNVLNVKGIPQHYTDREKYCFSDLGSWHGFGLPDSANYYGAFTGPFMIPYSVWQSKSLAKLTLLNADGQILDLASCKNPGNKLLSRCFKSNICCRFYYCFYESVFYFEQNSNC